MRSFLIALLIALPQVVFCQNVYHMTDLDSSFAVEVMGINAIHIKHLPLKHGKYYVYSTDHGSQVRIRLIFEIDDKGKLINRKEYPFGRDEETNGYDYYK